MLFKFEDGKPVHFSKEEVMKYREELAKVFPYSFGEGTSMPIKIEIRPELTMELQRFPKGKTDIPIGTSKQAPAATVIPAVETVTEQGYRVQYRFSTTNPVIDSKGAYVWNRGESIKIRTHRILDPVDDLELIIFLYFFSSEFNNGHRARVLGSTRAQNGRFQFVMPDLVGKERLQKLIFDEKVGDMIIKPSTRLSYADITAVSGIMRMGITGIEDVDRANIYESLRGNPKKLEAFERTLENMKGNKRNSADMSQINKKVKDGIKAGVVRQKDGAWWLTSTKGDGIAEIVKVSGSDKKEQEFALVEHLKLDTAIVERLNTLLEDLVPA